MHSGRLDVDAIRSRLNTRRIGRRIDYFDTVGSTNAEALERCAGSDADGLVILADWQTAGRGRLGRSWHSPRGGSVMLSAVVIDRSNRFLGDQISLIAAVAVHDALEQETHVSVDIKWPNDLLIRNRKVAGMLVESRPTDEAVAFVIGIGVNCLQHPGHFPEPIRPVATSLDMESSQPVVRETIVTSILTELDEWLAGDPSPSAESVREAWLARAAPMGGRVHLWSRGKEYAGYVIDVDPTGGLVVNLDQGGRCTFPPAHTTPVHSPAPE